MAWCEAFLDKAVLSRSKAVIIASRLEACTSVPFWLGGQRVLLLMLITWKTDVCVLGFIAAGQCATLAPRSLWQIATNATAQIYKLSIIILFDCKFSRKSGQIKFCNELIHQHNKCCKPFTTGMLATMPKTLSSLSDIPSVAPRSADSRNDCLWVCVFQKPAA